MRKGWEKKETIFILLNDAGQRMGKILTDKEMNNLFRVFEDVNLFKWVKNMWNILRGQ